MSSAGNEAKMEVDPNLVANMKAKTEAVYKAFQQAHQAMRSASKAIDELQAVMPPELQTLLPTTTSSDPDTQLSNITNTQTRKPQKGKPRDRSTPYTKVTRPSALAAAATTTTTTTTPTPTTPTSNVVSTNTPPGSPNAEINNHQYKKKASRSSPAAKTSPTTVTPTTANRREPPSFTPEQAALLDEFIKYFNLRVESTNIPQWKIGAEISQFAGNSIKMDQSTVSRMARRLGIPKSQTGVDAVKKWIDAEKERIAKEAENSNLKIENGIDPTLNGMANGTPVMNNSSPLENTTSPGPVSAPIDSQVPADEKQ
ncbi:hypothetical protein G9A89_009871 [Geosiphon pyriformis]|nr:hypothetical protein G9A89_009871 [Geosiphon pyriformis]